MEDVQNQNNEGHLSDKEVYQELDSAIATQKTRKRTSVVWDFFDRIEVNGVGKAKCRHCKAILTCATTGGTSHLKKHVDKTCPGRHLRLGSRGFKQQKLSIKTQSDGSASLDIKQNNDTSFDQEISRRELVNMVVMHEYPLSIVDHIGFRRFVQSLNSSFKMISRNTLKNDVMKLYQSERHNLKDLLDHNQSRVAITTDMWTASNQKKGYMVVTSHFIDEDWNLRSRTLRFSFVPCPHTKGIISKVLLDCVSQFGLESKISSVVVDNCSTNDAMMAILLRKFEKKSLILGGAILHMRCSAHILNLIVNDGLNVIKTGIENIRDCVSFWTLTPKRIEKFEDSCRYLKVNTSKMLVLDCKTRWNSTYLMLQSAFPYKDVFKRLKRLYGRLKFVVPSDDDWDLAHVVCEKLELFYKTTMVFSGRNYPTANLFFRKVCMIRIALRSWLQSDVEVISSMASKMIEKFDKYWREIDGILAIASILDPRNKMDCVEYYFRRLYDDEAHNELDRIRNMFDALLDEYQKKVVDHSSDLGGSSKAPLKNSLKRVSPQTSIDDEEDEFALVKKTKVRKVSVRCELDHYLESDTLPESDHFDILNFWKNDLKYPTLQKIARDILAIPISTVASESAFSTGGRVVSPHRSRLHAKTVEALMCLQSWMVEDIKGTLENPYACSTMIEDSDTEDGVDVIDVCDMDIDNDEEDD